jgi:hypothetical protein
MSCKTRAVFERPIGGKGAPLIVVPFLGFSLPGASETKFEIRIPKPVVSYVEGSETNRSQINQKYQEIPNDEFESALFGIFPRGS